MIITTIVQPDRRGGTAAIPAELLGGVPRAVRLTTAGVTVSVFATLMAAGALVSAILLAIASARANEQRQLRARETIRTDAEVVSVRVRRGDHPQAVVSYAFEVDGRSYGGVSSLPQRAARTITAQSRVAVGYLRSDPSSNWMIGREPRGVPLAAVLVLPAALLMGALAIVWAVRREWRLLSEGRVAHARVVGHTSVQRSHHRTNRVTYEFQTMSGAMRTGSYESQKKPPAEGAIVPIVYHRDNPSWTARYPLSLVRPARARAAWQVTSSSIR